eukprot:2074099-Prorocentrum_lima.AAC.1
MFETSIQRALMHDPGEQYAMWDPGASHFLFFYCATFPPNEQTNNEATGASRAVVRLAVGDT